MIEKNDLLENLISVWSFRRRPSLKPIENFMINIFFEVSRMLFRYELRKEHLYSLFFVIIHLQIYLVNIIPGLGFTHNKQIVWFCNVTFDNLNVLVFIGHQDSVDFVFVIGFDQPEVVDVRFHSLESYIGPQGAEAAVFREFVGFLDCLNQFFFFSSVS